MFVNVCIGLRKVHVYYCRCMNASTLSYTKNYLKNGSKIINFTQAIAKENKSLSLLLRHNVKLLINHHSVFYFSSRSFSFAGPVDKDCDIKISTDKFLYDDVLVQPLNGSLLTSNVKSPAENLFTEEEMNDLIIRQMNNEVRDAVFVPKFFKKLLENDPDLICIYNWEKDWRKCIRHSLNLKLQNENHFTEDHSIDIVPYLKQIPIEIIENFLVAKMYMVPSEILNGPLFRVSLIKNFGREFYQLSNRYATQKDYLKSYSKLCSSYIDRSKSLSYIPRLQWLHLFEPTSVKEDLPWNNDVQLAIGNYLSSVLITHVTIEVEGKSIKLVKQNRKKDDEGQLTTIHFAKILKDVLRRLSKNYLMFPSSKLPMVSPPVPWSTIHRGAYVTPKADLIRMKSSFGNILDASEEISEIIPPVLDSVNALASVPWKINNVMLDIVNKLFHNESWSAFELQIDESTHKEKIRGIRINKKRVTWCLSIANYYKNDVFWFPHSIDFRGRCYPIPYAFHYQLDDLNQAVLQFAQGKPLGSDGLHWLKIHLVNLTGVKKECTTEEKINFVNENLDNILDSADNPVEGRKWWYQFKENFRVLATCIEIAAALRCPNPEEYISHLPVYQDGSCNVLQHVAALSGDSKIAKSVNISPSERPQDIYQDMTNEIEKRRQSDAAQNPVAMDLEGFIQRKVFKQPFLRILYGTQKSTQTAPNMIAKELQRLNFPSDKAEAASSYLNDLMYGYFEKHFVTIMNMRNWLVKSALEVSKAQPHCISWNSPLGLTVIQPYQALMNKEEKTDELEIKSNFKHVRAFMPNFIHTLEATHLMLTALYCQEKGISMIGNHDSFWTHAADVSTMNKLCREQFVSMYSQPILENLRINFQDQIDKSSQNGSKISEAPKKGDLDLNCVQSSQYFFH